MRAVLLGVAAALWLSTSASAQPVATLADLSLRLNVGDTVTIDDAAGGAVRGTIVRFAPDALTIAVDDTERTFTGADVRRVRRRGDSLSNGLKWGAVIGAGLGCLAGASFAEMWRWDDCPAGIVLLGPIFLGGAVLVDAVHVGSETVYTAPARAFLGPRGARPAVGVRWTW